jgi:hypothetical protein
MTGGIGKPPDRKLYTLRQVYSSLLEGRDTSSLTIYHQMHP